MTPGETLRHTVEAASHAPAGPDVARRVLPLIDLTSLNDNDTEESIAGLCRRAVTPAGPVAAVCLWPRFVAQAKRRLDGTGVAVATVVNFPSGESDAVTVAEETRRAIGDGADEIDVVLPHRLFLAGTRSAAQVVLHACRGACGDGVVMKVILESGAFTSAPQLNAAAKGALAAGADFLKTSTGKTATGATPAAAAVMLGVLRGAERPAGFKASGGIRDTRQAAIYLALADRLMGAGWVGPGTFRFGASSLLDSVLADLP